MRWELEILSDHLLIGTRDSGSRSTGKSKCRFPVKVSSIPSTCAVKILRVVITISTLTLSYIFQPSLQWRRSVAPFVTSQRDTDSQDYASQTHTQTPASHQKWRTDFCPSQQIDRRLRDTLLFLSVRWIFARYTRQRLHQQQADIEFSPRGVTFIFALSAEACLQTKGRGGPESWAVSTADVASKRPQWGKKVLWVFMRRL